MSQIEKRGKPAVAWVAAQFAEDAHWSANVFGCPELAIVVVPDCFTNCCKPSIPPPFGPAKP